MKSVQQLKIWEDNMIRRKVPLKRKSTMQRKDEIQEAHKFSPMKLGFPKGGHTPYPPENCPSPRFSTNEQGVVWVDNGLCLRYCEHKRCAEYIEYRDFIRNKIALTEVK